MYTFVRTISGMPGKSAELRAFADQFKTYVKEKCNLDVGVSLPTNGNPDRIAFVAMTPRLSEFESAAMTLAADAEYQTLIATIAATVIPGLVHEKLWCSL